MKLTDLNPKYGDSNGIERTHIVFDCPKCQQHRISIPISGNRPWGHTGTDFELTTLTPSIASEYPPLCKAHFFITDGIIKMV